MGSSWDRAADARAVLIAGPTASGKSAAAMEAAEAAFRAGRKPVIVNADSMQLYQGLRIVTARPGADEEARCEHRLYGYVAPEERYSVARWLRDAEAVLAEAGRSGFLPVVVGGTGLYFMALTDGIAQTPPIPPAIRAGLAELLAASGPAALHERLRSRDPKAAASIRAGDAQRIVRALEVVEATGQTLTAWQALQERRGLLEGGGVERVVLEPERPRLYQRIEARFDAMVEAGALEEVRELVGRNLDPALPAMKAIGVRSFAAHLEGKIALPEAVAEAKTETRRYAKRQSTWFRNRMAGWRRIAV